MKILSITLRNLASIEGTNNIDFTSGALSNTRLYAISGSTGAGKSTILDAICLALYDCTPRFAIPGEDLYVQDVGDNQVHQSDVRNILRRGSGEGFAQVVFEAFDGQCYKSSWSVARDMNDPGGALLPQTMEVLNLSTGEEYSGTKEELLNRLVRLTGLTYEQFTRTVLLAQNDFATFLKCSEGQKAELLEKLTGTEIYSQISSDIYVKNRTIHSEINFLKNAIRQLEIISDEELQKMAEEREQLAPKREYAYRRLLVLNEQFKIITIYKQQQELLKEKKKAYAVIKESFDELMQQRSEQQEENNAFRQYMETLQPQLEKAAELDMNLRNYAEKHKNQGEVCASIILRRMNMAKSLADKELLFARELNWINDTEAESGDQKLAKMQKQVEEEKLNLQNLRAGNDERIRQLDKYGIGKLIKEQNAIISGQKFLHEARIKMLSRKGLLKEREHFTNELSVNCNQLEKLEKDLQELVRELEQKAGHMNALEKLYDSARIQLSQDVKAIREKLVDSEACPVCGSSSHPYKEQNEIPESSYNSIEQDYKKHLEDFQHTKSQYLIIERDIKKLREIIELLTSRIRKIDEEMEVCGCSEDSGLSMEVIEEKLASFAAAQQVLIDQMDKYQKLYDEWHLAEEEIRKQQSLYDELKDSLNFCQLLLQDVNSEKEQLASLNSIEMEESARMTAIENELEILEKERAGLLDGKIISEVQSNLQMRQNELIQQTEAITREMDKYHSSLLVLDGEIRQLDVTVKALEMERKSIENASELPAIIEKQKKLIDELDHRNVYLENKLLQQQENRINYKRMQEDIGHKQELAGKWEKLNWIIGSSDGTKFKIIAQSYTLNLLLLHANRHLGYLSSRYRLQQVPDTLALQIIDHEMCNEVRTIHSLSGGESFLISLALALGLSSLSSNNLKVESLFIDEGFGSLDNESLNTAMKALEQLYSQGRKIGIISHIQEMTERIPVKIHVEKTVNGKSRIEIRS